MNFPEMYEDVAISLIDSVPFDPETERFYNALKKVYTRESSLRIDEFKDELDEEELEKVQIYTLLVDEYYPDFTEDLARKEIKKLIKEINRKNIFNIKKDFELKIRISQDPQERKVLLNRYNELLKLSVKI